MRIGRWLPGIFTLLALIAQIRGEALAEPYPTKPIRLVASAAPGGTNDFLSRVIAEKMGETFGQPVVVDNRGGAGGTLAPGIVAKTPADGYTLVMVQPSHATSVHIYAKPSFDPIKDFSPVVQLVNSYFAVSVPASSPANTLAEFIALAKAKRGTLNYSSSGVGQAAQLGMELLKSVAGFDALHVPYAGLGPATTALIAGQVDASVLTLAAALPYAKTGQLKILAVTGAKRSTLLPDVPTVAESGFPGFELTSWQGLLAPAGTPRDVVEKLNQAAVKALRQPDVVQKLARFDLDPVGSTPDEFAAFIQSEVHRWGPIIKRSGTKAD
jgi:tripartite-type tricarboxylate transporter receptor subunit TctC